ncbi:gamma-tubulin complex component 5 [Penaeus vannamei]|uniref:gamma-tubulin complex component 5 n=1 Tax=Penaeus vannamei TaxID=6689 RepID=UPI00387F6218
MSLSMQGKFDELSKELINHVLGFEEGEENFIRSEQYVLSNLLYHHCLAVNSHNVRRSIDGLVLKFSIHGQHHRSQQLQNLTSKFLASPFFKDHDELDIEWSLLSLLLHLSNSPTQVPVSDDEILLTLNKSSSPVKSLHLAEENIDWVAYLRQGEPEYVVGVEQPLSDWSSDDEKNETEDEALYNQYSPIKSSSVAVKDTCNLPRAPTAQELLEQSHRAQSWLAANTHTQYWGSKKYQQCAPLSSHPAANVAKLWETKCGSRGSQQLSEWAVMRETVWVLMCPSTSHIFQYNADQGFVVHPEITIPSLTPGAAKRLLEELCLPLNQLLEIDAFLKKCEVPSVDPPFPVTLQAYATGIRLWRHRFQSHLATIEDQIKKQESTCTLSWLEGELYPWLRTLSAIATVHSMAAMRPEISPREAAVRLINGLCDGVESAGEPGVRCVLLRLLLHTLRHYLSIINNWLLHGSLVDHAQEFIIQRSESVKVTDETFWHDAFILNPHHQSEAKQSRRSSLKFLSPLVGALTTVGKSRELLAVLDVEPLPRSSAILYLHQKSKMDPEMVLEEVIIRHIQDALYGSSEKAKENTEGNEGVADDSSALTEVDQHMVSNYQQVDPLLLAAFIGDAGTPASPTMTAQKDSVTRMIEDMAEVPRAISVVSLLSSAISPLIRKKEEELSARLTQVLLEKYHMDRHCQAVRSILLMEAGDVMHEFYSHLFSKIDIGESIDGISLTLHLQDCVTRLVPDLAPLFSVSVSSASGFLNSAEENKTDNQSVPADSMLGKDSNQTKEEEQDKNKLGSDSTTMPLSKAGLPDISINYQVPYPVNLLLSEKVLSQYNILFRFCLSIKRATNGLERLKFKDLASWNAVIGSGSNTEDAAGPLLSRLHRLQLLRLWLLCFTRELHDHFANTVFLPFHQTVEKLFLSRPSLNVIITEHEKLLNRLITNCLMGSGKTSSPLQIVLNKVFWLSQRLGQLWRRDIGRVTCNELSAIETQYAQVHRYLVNFLTRLTTTNYLPHLEGLTRTLVDTVPLLTQP